MLIADDKSILILLQPPQVQGHARHKKCGLKNKDKKNSNSAIQAEGLKCRKSLEEINEYLKTEAGLRQS